MQGPACPQPCLGDHYHFPAAAYSKEHLVWVTGLHILILRPPAVPGTASVDTLGQAAVGQLFSRADDSGSKSQKSIAQHLRQVLCVSFKTLVA